MKVALNALDLHLITQPNLEIRGHQTQVALVRAAARAVTRKSVQGKRIFRVRTSVNGMDES
jgi:hypothetical protein